MTSSTALKKFKQVVSRPIVEGKNLFNSLRGHRAGPEVIPIELPLRDELFCAEQMTQHGKHLAQKHVLGGSDHRDLLLSRLDDNEQRLIETHSLLTVAVKNKLPIVPAGEWLLDNFYLLDEQFNTARRHLPKNYSRELPCLAEGPSNGLPRVYDLAMEVISHGDGRVDNEAITLFVDAYQSVSPLLLGELWAVPIMLRLAMIENLRRVSVRIAAARVNVNLAQAWSNKMLEVAENDPKGLILVIADMARSDPPMVSSFVAELERCLQGHGSALALPLTWIRQRLTELSLTIEQLVLSENQQQAADQVSVSNTIGSLRFLGATDWREFIESMSLVEQVLCSENAAVYPKMDFPSRDGYRQVIDALAKRGPILNANRALSEIHAAQTAVDLAQSGAEKHGPAHHTAHVGFYLIDQGLPLLEAALGVKLTIVERVSRSVKRCQLMVYLGSILLLTVALSGSVLLPAYYQGVAGWRYIVLSGLVILVFSQLASSLVNWLVTLMVKPQLLPRMDYSQGLPVAQRTLVVIPCMLTNEAAIADLLEALEVRFLASRDARLHFALLSDFDDADDEKLPTDAGLLAMATRRIELLNQKYCVNHALDQDVRQDTPPAISDQQEKEGQFYILHRPRRWNATQKKWMGYERKRGKLSELNSALRGSGWHRFSSVTGDVEALSDVKYIITLDTDTELPRDSARQFIATMAHPLNHPRFDKDCRRVIGGYGILQPRMAASLSGANRSRYAQLCGSEPGIDPYTRSVSDIYQDLFAEGSFIGKGIYDIDAFEFALDRRFPENRILSHDLLEGCYARSGLLSDVHLYEEYPAKYQADIARQQRWIRGDWQIADWLMRRVPSVDGEKERNPLSMLSQWKILDNLRRSLIPVALSLLLLTGWFLIGQPWLWTLVVVAVLMMPPWLAGIVDGLRRPQGVIYSRHLAAVVRSLRQSSTLTLFRFACLPYEAWINLSAILRTSWRVLGAHNHLLDWNVSNHQSPIFRNANDQINTQALAAKEDGICAAYRTMWIAPAVALGALAGSAITGPHLLIAVVPVAGLWLLAPVFSWWLSKPLAKKAPDLSGEQLLFLRRIARKTWSFFDTFVTARDNWLPPDNFQENPGPVLAHRTSPTNIGLSLLANVGAVDFAYISIGTMLQRSADTFETLDKLERHHGHFLNWYDTETLQPLPPRYISSVDSGNLAGHLLTLRSALLELPMQAMVSPRVFDGLADSMSVLQEAVADALSAINQTKSPARRQPISYETARQAFDPDVMAELQSDIEAASALESLSLTEAALCLHRIAQTSATLMSAATNLEVVFPAHLSNFQADDIAGVSDASSVEGPDENEKLCLAILWLQSLVRQAQDGYSDLLKLAPWLVVTEMPESVQQLMTINGIPTLAELLDHTDRWLDVIDRQGEDQEYAGEAISAVEWQGMPQLRAKVRQGRSHILDRMAQVQDLARRAGGFAAMDYEPIYNRTRHLLSVGYNVDDCRCDTSYYDLLASEARLCNFVAIAQGQLPQESWFSLGRLLTKAGGEPVLVSWSGSMFEYLMPLLVMPMYDSSLLDQSCSAAVTRQIAYGKQRGLPWGASESGYNIVDASLIYQYHAFGVPGLGLKRGLAEESVIAPYASALALMIAPEQACQNLQRLSSDGIEGRFGFYEAVDYTPARLLRDQTQSVVRSFMAHHQGMTLLSLVYLLLDQPMQRRFIADPALQSTLLLLQERIPETTVLDTRIAEHSEGEDFTDALEASLDARIPAETPTPEVQLLSNGRYQVMVTNAGGGYSRWHHFALTRWREDSIRDNWGSFIYLRDVDSGNYWSAAHQPTCRPTDSYAAMFSEGRAEFRRQDSDVETYTEIMISPEDDVELRRVRLTNRSLTRKTIEITSYSEVVLSTPDADEMQSAFGKLFVQTEVLKAENAILCSRRPRSAGEHSPWLFHLLGTNGTAVEAISFETDRMRFIGRGRTPAAPQAMDNSTPLSGSEGSVLDPIVAIRCEIVLEPRQALTIDLIFGAASSREECMTLVGRYQDRHLADRVVDLAGTHSGVILRQINARQQEAQLYRRLASAVIYVNSSLRAEASVLIQNRRGQSGLWGYAISGDLPIVLLKITDISCLDHARQLIQCHAYWRLKGLAVDLVIWNENHIGYRQQLQDQIMGLIATGTDANKIDRPGGIFVRFSEQISLEDRILLQSVARVIIVDSAGTLIEQINRRTLSHTSVPKLIGQASEIDDASAVSRSPGIRSEQRTSLKLTNSLGGFNDAGDEYQIITTDTSRTPTPWVNVIANPQFGTVITESGLAYSWNENAHEFRLSPWSDDPVGSTGGEAIYLRDEVTGKFWSPTAQPHIHMGDRNAVFKTRHGFGYSVFEHTSADNISSELRIFVDLEDPVKFSVLRIHNDSDRTRHLSATAFVEWVLGDLRAKTAMHVVTHIDPGSGALFATNEYNTEFAGRVAFFDVDDMSRTLTGDRNEFLGRNGSLEKPDALTRMRLSGRVGAALDPCGALQVSFILAPGEDREFIFRLGAGRNAAHASELAQRLRTAGTASAALERVKLYWQHTLSAVQIETPDPALNVLANGWLVYQTLASRLWARSGYSQSGGAYGFRDQLQDAMALVHTQPALLRAQILLCAQRQYPEGDVQHWWHPPSGRGVRTRCSDDYLWLPLATCCYVQTTGDVDVLGVSLNYLTGRALNPDEESYYDLPDHSAQSASLYEHCRQAIEHGFRVGERGLPLMGSGDWNDGMNLVGIEGKGESVWLGFFLYKVLVSFAEVAVTYEDVEFSERCLEKARSLRNNLALHAWDGDWYRRAWFDNGMPLGSSSNAECRIDSISQSWSVLSGAGDQERSLKAMNSLDQHLVKREQGLVQLLDPPFDHSTLDPGYIKGYVPGVRENGGQYTHAAIWAAMAFAQLGDSKRAWELTSMINPVNHTLTAEGVNTYKTEPYVVAADVYAIAPHTGRGGWTWYTGSAGWFYRLTIESLMGLGRRGDRLLISPCLPQAWDQCAIRYRFGETVYRIEIRQSRSTGETTTNTISLDGVDVDMSTGPQGVLLVDDQQEHLVRVVVHAGNEGDS